MTYDFRKLIFLIPGEDKTSKVHHYINNPDGTPRWIWPVDNKEPDFLRFYNVSIFKSKLFVLIVRLVFMLRLQSFVFKKTKIAVPVSMGDSWALFTGTVGVQQKMVLFQHGTFSKIPIGIHATKSLHTEKSTLSALQNTTFQHIELPKNVELSNFEFSQSAFDQKLVRIATYSSIHTAAIKEIFEQENAAILLNEYEPFQRLEKTLASLYYNDRMPLGLQGKLMKIYHQLDISVKTEYGFAHGDFTSWNMYKSGDKLFIYDWEATNHFLPKGFDNFHFIIQQAILIDCKSWKEIYQTIIQYLLKSEFAIFDTKVELDHYLKMYLLHQISRAMSLYNQQEKWHLQIYWMIDTWNDALDQLESPLDQQHKFTSSLFDHLKPFRHAVMKAHDGHPDTWPADSDIDLLIERKEVAHLIHFCKSSPLTTKVVSTSRSFMTNIVMYFYDGGFLSLDLIHQLKRKSIVFMNAESLLKKSTVNEYGIKTLYPKDEARYIGWFYALNNAPIPAKYKKYLRHLQNVKSEEDQLISAYFRENHEVSKDLRAIVQTKADNQGIRGLINKFFYFVDTAKSFLRFDGLVITFSGVDGAGKSTIIEKIKYKIEKSLRKEVIVLRHRPSILPILSAIKHGKEKAEAISVSKLPRTGNNENRLSSLLRFAYYYFDYLFGQFYIYIKYVMRGKVVLYDRYYFDFINDGKRSNIQLPASWVKFGYRFLLKPDLNYFLYADAKTIIERKQELDINTIELLTINYKNLFDSYAKTYHSSSYFSINNVKLDDTISILLNNIKNKVAQA